MVVPSNAISRRWHLLTTACLRRVLRLGPLPGCPWFSLPRRIRPDPSETPFFGRFHSLCIDDGGRRACLSAFHLAHLHKQHVVDAVEHTVARPFPKIIVDGGARWKIFRQLPPLASRTQHVAHRVHDLPHVGLAMPPTPTLRRDQGRNDRPGGVAGLVGIKCGVVSGVFNLESSGVEAPDWRPRHDKHYHEA
jgi:hypothetical protein